MFWHFVSSHKYEPILKVFIKYIYIFSNPSVSNLCSLKLNWEQKYWAQNIFVPESAFPQFFMEKD